MLSYEVVSNINLMGKNYAFDMLIELLVSEQFY